MRKTKNILLILLMLLIAILNCYNLSFAAEKSFTCGLKADKTEANIGDEVTITFSLATISGFENGIMGISAELEYDEDVLKYVSKNALNDWNVSYEENSKIVSAYIDEYVSSATDIFTMTFKINDTTKEESTIKIKKIMGSEESDDIDSEDVSVTIKIAKKQEETKPSTGDNASENPEAPSPDEGKQDQNPETPSSDEGKKEQNPGTNDKIETPEKDNSGSKPSETKQEDNKNANISYPKTGIEYIVLIITISSLIVIGIVSYAKYKKYKNIR